MTPFSLHPAARLLAGLAGLALAGCAVTPSSIVAMPTTARPLAVAPNNAATGSIFQNSAYRPLFEDRRARQVGDVLIITITESTNAVKAGSSSGTKTGSVAANLPKPLQSRFGATLATSTSNKFTDADNQAASNTFSGSIGVTVSEVLSNGNLVVTGEKQIGMDKGNEYIRFSGVVNPDTIASGNTVVSTQVADARVEYRTNAQIDRAEWSSMMSRFFLSVLPF